jgi:hypothetical protein
VIIGYQLLGAVYLLTMVIIRPPFLWTLHSAYFW